MHIFPAVPPASFPHTYTAVETGFRLQLWKHKCVLTSQLRHHCAVQPRSLLWTHLPQSFVLPCLGAEERCYGSDRLHSFCCYVAHSWHPDYGCVKSVLGAEFTHSFPHTYRLNILFLGRTGKRYFPPILCLYTGGSKHQFHTVVCEDSGAFCISDPVQPVKNLPLLIWKTPPQGGEKYNPFLWDATVMEEQAGHIHVEGFRMRGTPGKPHTLQFSEAWIIFRSDCTVNSSLCRKPV